MSRIALIGFGAIGQAVLAQLLDEPSLEICAVVVPPAMRDQVAVEVGQRAPGASVCTAIALEGSRRPDLVVECAGHAALVEHVLPALAKMPLEKLTASDLDALYASLLVRGRKAATRTGEGLAPKTVRSIHLVVHKALADAERKGLLIRNVAALADPPKVGAR